MLARSDPVELISCPNCLAVYGDVQGECPSCGADGHGEGAEHEFDGTTRAAIASLGGLYGGILECGPGVHLLWCEAGVCRVDELTGLVWKARVGRRVDALSHDEVSVRITSGGREVVLDLADGAASG